jgi:transaldolase
MSWFQAYIAMKAEADYISLFYGRIGDMGFDPVAVIKDTITVKLFSYPVLKDYVKERENIDGYGKTGDEKKKNFFDMLNFPRPISSQIIVGSIRGGHDLVQILPTCPDIITVPYKILKNITDNPKSLEAMAEMNKKYKEKINGK